MARVCLEFLDEPGIESRSALRLRRTLERTCGVERISISIKRQVIFIDHNPLFLHGDAVGEKLADLGFVVRPAGRGEAVAPTRERGRLGVVQYPGWT